MEKRRILLALFAALTLARAASAQGTYDYSGPIVARDGAFSCIGKTPADADKMNRNFFFGLLNRSTTSPMTVMCPLNRRNFSPYGKTSRIVDSVLFQSVEIYLRNKSISSPIKCRVFAYSSKTANAHLTSWVSATGTGYTTITFTNPFGTTALANERIASIG